MSWQDRLNSIQFEIVTNNGKTKSKWHPLLVPSFQKNIEFNGTQYDFIGRYGSMFIRRLPKGRSFQLEFAFAGADNDKMANAFEIASRAPYPWTVTHPFYGKFYCQPLSLDINNSSLDSTVIKVQVIESQLLDPNTSAQLSDGATKINAEIDFIKARSLAVGANTPISAKELEGAKGATKKIGSLVTAVIKTDSERKSFKKFLDGALSEIDNAAYLAEGYLTHIQNLINLPATVSSNIGSRINCIEGVFSSLIADIKGTAKPSYFKKLFYNILGVTCISAMSKALQTQNTGDLQTKIEITFYLDELQSTYLNYLTMLYSLPNFTPDHDLMFSLNSLVLQTMFSLYGILLSAKQERTHYPAADTNLILLAHRLYGSASEQNIDLIKSTNKIGLSELINVKRGRKIVYYV